jgi:hypothetical protein
MLKLQQQIQCCRYCCCCCCEHKKSIQSTRTFLQKTYERKILFGELSRNVETACSQLRGEGLLTKGVYIFLKPKLKWEKYVEKYFELPNYTNSDTTIMKLIERLFDKDFNAEKLLYKKSGVIFTGLKSASDIPPDLFGEQDTVYEDEYKLTSVIDSIRNKYGFNVISLASSLEVNKSRGEDYKRRHMTDVYDTGLPYPFLGVTN